MTCQEANELITALVDNELSNLERQEIENHLESCSNCENIYQQELELKRHIHSIGARVSAHPELSERILSDPRIFPSSAESPLGWKGHLWPARVMARPAFALALLVLLILPIFYLMWPTGGSISLAALETHAKINSGDLYFSRVAGEQEVKKQLGRTVGGRFAPMGYDLSTIGLRPVGGLVQEFGERKVLVAVYRGSAPSVSCFTFLGTEQDAPPQARMFFDPEKKTNYYTFTDGAVNGVMHRVGERICLLVSKMPMEKILNMVRSLPYHS